jgi:predicted metalloprotease with PDZ domain
MLGKKRSRIVRSIRILLAALSYSFCVPAHLIAAPIQPGLLSYQLRYAGAGDSRVSLQITPETPLASPVTLIIPRSYPGGYSFVRYDDFVEQVHAFSPDGKSLDCGKDPDGPRWAIGAKGQNVARIEYRVDIKKMDDQIRDSVESSKLRDGYLMILGYSVFGYIDGLEKNPVALEAIGPRDWPVLSTLDPQPGTQKENTKAKAANFDTLADSQVAMGPSLQFRRLAGKINLIVASYSEVEEDLDAESKMAREALDRVQEYFGDIPFPTYTALLEFLKPQEGHSYGFSQEHDSSGTFSLSVESATNAQSSANHRSSATFNYAHHMAHCWIPKRVWGAGYRPYNWELTPIIETIWFNEGFGRYAAMQALVLGMTQQEGKALRERSINRTRGVLDSAPDFIKRMPLPRLSQEASFLYGDDFRMGMNIFSRGFLIAAEMDDRIQSQTGGQKSMRDAYRALLTWSAQNQRAFQVDELTRIISESTGVNVEDIMARWMRPLSP